MVGCDDDPGGGGASCPATVALLVTSERSAVCAANGRGTEPSRATTATTTGSFMRDLSVARMPDSMTGRLAIGPPAP